MLLNEYAIKGKGREEDHSPNIDDPVLQWMSTGFTKPSDLAGDSKLVERRLVYLPFWVIDVDVTTSYEGDF